MKHLRPLASADPAQFRRIMGRFATGVTVITAGTDGNNRGMTANAFMSGSLHPPLCVISVAKRAHMHDHLIAAGAFAVNFLAAGQEKLATHFAGRRIENFEPTMGDFHGIPGLIEASAMITAAVSASHDCGDHTLFVGAIISMVADDRAPLLYHASAYAALLPLREPAPAMVEFW